MIEAPPEDEADTVEVRVPTNAIKEWAWRLGFVVFGAGLTGGGVTMGSMTVGAASGDAAETVAREVAEEVVEAHSSSIREGLATDEDLEHLDKDLEQVLQVVCLLADEHNVVAAECLPRQ